MAIWAMIWGVSGAEFVDEAADCVEEDGDDRGDRADDEDVLLSDVGEDERGVFV